MHLSPFTVKVSHLIDEVDILKQDGSARSDSLSRGFHANWSAMSGSRDGSSVLEIIKKCAT